MNAEIVFHQRHREGNIPAHEIERRIADDRRKQNALLPVTIFGGDDFRISELNFSWRRRAERLKQSSEEAIRRCSY